MNVLTKVFVVLMTILSVVLVSLVVPFVANTENYKDLVASAKQEAAGARTEAILAQQRSTASQSELNAQLNEMGSKLSGQVRLNDTLRSELSKATADLESARGAHARTQADIANLTAANKQMSDIAGKREEELSGLRTETVKQAKQIVELEAAVNDQASATATLRRQLRLAQENLVKTQEELTQANQKLAQAPATTPGTQTPTGPVTPPVAINGQVSDVRQAGEVTLVQLNIGSSSGAKERMLFQVHREGQYVGSVVLMTVDEQAAVGRVTLLKNGATIRTGDGARSGPVN